MSSRRLSERNAALNDGAGVPLLANSSGYFTQQSSTSLGTRHASGMLSASGSTRFYPRVEDIASSYGIAESFKNRTKQRRHQQWRSRAAVEDQMSENSNDEHRKRRVAAYCTAEVYDIDGILSFYEKYPNREVTMHRDVLHVHDNNDRYLLSACTSSICLCSFSLSNHRDFFVFSYGCIIFWGYSGTADKGKKKRCFTDDHRCNSTFPIFAEVLSALRQFAVNQLGEVEYDVYDFWVGKTSFKKQSASYSSPPTHLSDYIGWWRHETDG
jgi:hypothetical protein